MSKEFEEKQKEAFVNYLTSYKEGQEIEFDMYARDIADFNWLKEFIPGIVIYSAGGILPFQAEGYLDGFNFYYRERGGVASLKLANSKEDCYDLASALYTAEIEVEEFREGFGWFSTLMNLIEKLEKPPYRYEFQKNAIDYGADGNTPTRKLDENGEVIHSSFPGWGFTVEEAFTSASNAIERMRERFCNRTKVDPETREIVPDPENNRSNEQFDEYVKMINLQPIVDFAEGFDRVYPEKEPVFEIKVPEIWRDENGIIEIPDSFWNQ